jgi:hypothetical protein
MSSGNYRRPFSPAYMEGWSRLQLGWVTVRDVTASGSYELGPYAAGDTIFRIVPTQPNPRGEFFLLENRQGVGSDTALITSKGPGLLVFHIDQQQITQRSDFNDVNSGAIHGVWLRQADGLDQLRSSVTGVVNRGDAGDPYPGTANNRRFGFDSNPSATLNAGGGTGFVVDSIRQLVSGGAMGLTVTFLGPLSVVDTALRAPIMGAIYADTLRVGGAVGSLTFTILSGALPPGLTLATDGAVAGIPTATGVSTVVVRASASGVRIDLPLQLSTSAPTLVPAAVGDQLLLGGTHLTADEIRYLDLLGNQNGALDIGDVAAWIDTGVTLDAASRRRLIGDRP